MRSFGNQFHRKVLSQARLTSLFAEQLHPFNKLLGQLC